MFDRINKIKFSDKDKKNLANQQKYCSFAPKMNRRETCHDIHIPSQHPRLGPVFWHFSTKNATH